MKILLTLLTVGLSIAVLGQPLHDDSVTNCVIHWRRGEMKTYSIIHSKSMRGESTNSNPFRFEYLAHISVIDSSAESLTIKWEYDLPDGFKAMHPGLADSLLVYNGMQMIFKISAKGTFLTLVNWEQVKDTYIKQLELSLPKSPDSGELARRKAAEQLFNSKETVESTLIQEIQLFHAPYGTQFRTRETRAETHLPNPFGGEPFPAYLTFQLTSVDKGNDRYTINTKLIMDKGNVDKLLDPILKKMHITDDAGIAEAKKALGSYNLQDRSEYRLIQSTGWIDRLSYARTIFTGAVDQTESFTIQLQ